MALGVPIQRPGIIPAVSVVCRIIQRIGIVPEAGLLPGEHAHVVSHLARRPLHINHAHDLIGVGRVVIQRPVHGISGGPGRSRPQEVAARAPAPLNPEQVPVDLIERFHHSDVVLPAPGLLPRRRVLRQHVVSVNGRVHIHVVIPDAAAPQHALEDLLRRPLHQVRHVPHEFSPCQPHGGMVGGPQGRQDLALVTPALSPGMRAIQVADDAGVRCWRFAAGIGRDREDRLAERWQACQLSGIIELRREVRAPPLIVAVPAHLRRTDFGGAPRRDGPARRVPLLHAKEHRPVVQALLLHEVDLRSGAVPAVIILLDGDPAAVGDRRHHVRVCRYPRPGVHPRRHLQVILGERERVALCPSALLRWRPLHDPLLVQVLGPPIPDLREPAQRLHIEHARPAEESYAHRPPRERLIPQRDDPILARVRQIHLQALPDLLRAQVLDARPGPQVIAAPAQALELADHLPVVGFSRDPPIQFGLMGMGVVHAHGLSRRRELDPVAGPLAVPQELQLDGGRVGLAVHGPEPEEGEVLRR